MIIKRFVIINLLIMFVAGLVSCKSYSGPGMMSSLDGSEKWKNSDQWTKSNSEKEISKYYTKNREFDGLKRVVKEEILDYKSKYKYVFIYKYFSDTPGTSLYSKAYLTQKEYWTSSDKEVDFSILEYKETWKYEKFALGSAEKSVEKKGKGRKTENKTEESEETSKEKEDSSEFAGIVQTEYAMYIGDVLSFEKKSEWKLFNPLALRETRRECIIYGNELLNGLKFSNWVRDDKLYFSYKNKVYGVDFMQYELKGILDNEKITLNVSSGELKLNFIQEWEYKAYGNKVAPVSYSYNGSKICQIEWEQFKNASYTAGYDIKTFTVNRTEFNPLYCCLLMWPFMHYSNPVAYSIDPVATNLGRIFGVDGNFIKRYKNDKNNNDYLVMNYGDIFVKQVTTLGSNGVTRIYKWETKNNKACLVSYKYQPADSDNNIKLSLFESIAQFDGNGNRISESWVVTDDKSQTTEVFKEELKY